MPVRRHEKAAELIAQMVMREDPIRAWEARALVRQYYAIQRFRLRAEAQSRATQMPTLDLLARVFAILEAQCEKILDVYTDTHPMGTWLRGIKGIGPVLSAGLLAYIDIERVDYVGRVYSYAGLVPSEKLFESNGKRNYNATFKSICFKIARSFVMLSNHPDCYYGKIYKEAKEKLTKRNESGGYADVARRKLERALGRLSAAQRERWLQRLEAALSPEDLSDVRILPAVDEVHEDEDNDEENDEKKKKDVLGAIWTWHKGKLTASHIDLMARRIAIKIFLDHVCRVWAKRELGRDLPPPYPISILGHDGFIPPPSW